jgi:hypothetical protein
MATYKELLIGVIAANKSDSVYASEPGHMRRCEVCVRLQLLDMEVSSLIGDMIIDCLLEEPDDYEDLKSKYSAGSGLSDDDVLHDLYMGNDFIDSLSTDLPGLVALGIIEGCQMINTNNNGEGDYETSEEVSLLFDMFNSGFIGLANRVWGDDEECLDEGYETTDLMVTKNNLYEMIVREISDYIAGCKRFLDCQDFTYNDLVMTMTNMVFFDVNESRDLLNYSWFITEVLNDLFSSTDYESFA